VTTGYTPPTYQTNWVQVPVTTYRAVITTDPATGLPMNAVQPCTTYTWQARRTPTTWFSRLWSPSAPPFASSTASPTVTAYAPQTVAPPVIGYGGTTTMYAPQQAAYPPATVAAPAAAAYAPTTTQYAPATSYPEATCAGLSAPTTAPPAAAPYGNYPANTAPATTYPPTSAPPASYPLSATPPATPSSTPPLAPPTPVPADVAPRLDPSGLNSAPTIRNYGPVEVEARPLAPVTPVTPESHSSRLDGSTNRAAAQTPLKQPTFVPFARPEPAAPYTPPANNKLRLVPDPDAQRLDLRREEIPNLINPGDRSTHRPTSTHFASVPIAWPERPSATSAASAPPAIPTTTAAPQVELAAPQRTFVPASISAETLDDRGWTSLSK
jgi:hypothetical protein